MQLEVKWPRRLGRVGLCVLVGLYGWGDAFAQQAAAAKEVSVTIPGQVFIVTKGRDNVRLALVEVVAISDEEFGRHLESAIEARQQLVPSLLSARQERDQREHEFVAADRNLLKAKWVRDETSIFAFNEKKEAQAAYERAEGEKNKARALAEGARVKFENVRKQYLHIGSPQYFRERQLPATALTKSDVDGKFSLMLRSGKYAVLARSSRSVSDGIELYQWMVRIEIPSPMQTLMLSNDNLMETRCRECIVLPDALLVAGVTEERNLDAGSPDKIFGWVVGELSAERRSLLRLSSGVEIKSVSGRSLAEGLKAGDAILRVNKWDVKNLDDFNKALIAMPTHEPVALLVRDESGTRFLVLKPWD